MAGLPETAVQSEGEIMGEKECAVCLGAYEASDTVRTLPCSHGFHERCIFQWLRVSRLCPLCRFALPAAAEETESFADEEDDDDDGEEDDDNGDGEEDHDDTLESIQFCFCNVKI
ncbi:E3 ubiquitin-protein ligase RNF181 [Setaria italica]|uniref:E3 ubiquitin-protein ligase RNF181 n=1 Tax=Setaria italica TaxID=4555 RepID=UPI0003513F16|nr:E3 ubiquitin-protein ligase RNF181 [Setaria italica]